MVYAFNKADEPRQVGLPNLLSRRPKDRGGMLSFLAGGGIAQAMRHRQYRHFISQYERPQILMIREPLA